MARQPRQFSAQFKFDIVMQLLRAEKTITELCREHQLKDSLIYRWRDELLARGPQVYEKATNSGASAERAHIAELERLVGRQAMELAAVKKRRACCAHARRTAQPDSGTGRAVPETALMSVARHRTQQPVLPAPA